MPWKLVIEALIAIGLDLWKKYLTKDEEKKVIHGERAEKIRRAVREGDVNSVCMLLGRAGVELPDRPTETLPDGK